MNWRPWRKKPVVIKTCATCRFGADWELEPGRMPGQRDRMIGRCHCRAPAGLEYADPRSVFVLSDYWCGEWRRQL